MTDIYRSDILAVVMNQLVDEPVLPTLFLRTVGLHTHCYYCLSTNPPITQVIQAVTTYRTLVGFVSSTLLTRLITKKIWTVPPLWDGFIRCAKLIAPASFGALLQLPKDQLRDIIEKQPSLKAGLREYLMKKAGNKSRVSGLLDLFADDEAQPQSAPATPSAIKSADGTPDPPTVTDSIQQEPVEAAQNEIPPVDIDVLS